MTLFKASDDFEKTEGTKKGISIIEATLALIDSIIGAGIVSTPYAMTITGFVNGIYINLATIAILTFCSHLYIKAISILNLHSISELCFILMGRTSVYIFNYFLALIFFGILVMFNVLFSNLALSLF